MPFFPSLAFKILAIGTETAYKAAQEGEIMGWLSSLNEVAKVAAKVSVLPVAGAADMCGLSIDDICDGGKTFTERVVTSAKDSAEKIADKLDE